MVDHSNLPNRPDKSDLFAHRFQHQSFPFFRSESQLSFRHITALVDETCFYLFIFIFLIKTVGKGI